MGDGICLSGGTVPGHYFIVPYQVREVPGICLCDAAEDRIVPHMSSREQNRGDCLLVELDPSSLVTTSAAQVTPGKSSV